jgi:hypothetical protein
VDALGVDEGLVVMVDELVKGWTDRRLENS